MILNKDKRTTQAKLLLVLSAVSCLGIMPFIFYRAIQNDWFMVMLDLVIVIGMALVFVHVYKTNRIKYTSLGFALVALVGSAVSLYFNGGSIVNWIYPAMLSTFFVVKPKLALLINASYILICSPKLTSIFTSADIGIILMSVAITNIIAYGFAEGLRVQEIELKRLASEDCLTSTGNRRHLDLKLLEIYDILNKTNEIASLIILDIDHFKKINDTHGHIKGDEILVELAKLLKEFFANTKYSIFRYGGEEFIITCAQTNSFDTYGLADNFRKLVIQKLDVAGTGITVSLGVAEYIKKESIQQWMHRVDLALYEAKNLGRDRVIQAKIDS